MKKSGSNSVPDKSRLIIETASRLFSRRGYFETKMSDIAREAGIAVGTIYLYYANKDDLRAGIYQYSSETLLNRIENRSAGETDPLDKFTVYLEESIAYSFEHPDLFLIVFVDFQRMEIQSPRRLFFSNYRKYIALGESVLEEGQGKGIFRFSASAASLILGITAMWAALVLRKVLDPHFKADEITKAEILSLVRTTVLEGILAGPARSPAEV